MHVSFVLFLLLFQYLAKRLAEKSVSEITYFVSGGHKTLTQSFGALALLDG